MFNLIRREGPLTRSELVERTGMARSTVVSWLDLLTRSGLITTTDDAVSTGGRPAARFVMDPLARCVAAVDFGATHLTIALADLCGTVIVEHDEPCDIADGPEVLLDRAADLIGTLQQKAALKDVPLASIGIGVPGPVQHSTGRPTNPPIMPGWDNFDVPGYVQRRYPVPVLVDNDVNIMAIGEHAAYWPDVAHMLFVKVATGVGSGIISDRRINRGSQGTAGDLGHVQVLGAEDRLCRCGNTGCLEALVSGPAIAADLRDRGCNIDSTQELIAAARQGDPAVIEAVRSAGRHIGAVLASCVSLLNPSLIVVGGSMSTAGEHLLAGIRESVYQRAMPLAAQDLRIVYSTAAKHAGVFGAATIAIDAVLSRESVEEMVAAAVG